ncbi:MAG: NUDIX hydrolase [Hyphomicrobiales bacterium]|nr:NUDIX hydrolase [Hyphomicrobiales bacterium]
MSYTYLHPHPAVTTDIIVFTVQDDVLKVLLIQRLAPPHEGSWALPGGFVEIEESLDACALRELHEETGLEGIYLEQLYTFGEPGRDPRERVISIAYFALVPSDKLVLQPGSDASAVAWYPISALPELAFDHEKITNIACQRLTDKMEYSTIGLMFMSSEFTLSQVQSLYEVISGKPRDKRNFRKWLLSLDAIEETGRKKAEGAYRPAKLYRLKESKIVSNIR